MKRIRKVIDNNLCLGCGLCESLIKGCKLGLNKEGFYKPKFKDSIETYEEQLSKVEKICPSLNVNVVQSTKNNLLWGNIESIHRGYSNNIKIRHKGSSGGVITELATSLLDSNEVDTVLQIGAKKDFPIKNDTFSNKNIKDILHCAGSRYAPSSLLSNIQEELLKDEKFLIIGKPCDITALKNYLNSYPEFKSKVVCTISFFCAGIPSHNATLQLVSKLGVQDVSAVSKFNYRGGGWPGKVQIATNDGNNNSCSYEDSWGKILGRDLNKRCKLCPDGIGLEADLVCADSWESSNGYPDFVDKPGYSLVISRNKVGNDILQNLLERKRITLEDMDVNILSQIQPYQWNRIVYGASRLVGARLKGYKFNFNGFNFARKALLGSIKHHILNFKGVLQRI